MRERERVKRFLKIRGFTLIELLVVISIIGFLATASMVVFNSIRVKARNSKRNQDIKQLMTAFGLAVDSADGTIPTTSGSGPALAQVVMVVGAALEQLPRLTRLLLHI